MACTARAGQGSATLTYQQLADQDALTVVHEQFMEVQGIEPDSGECSGGWPAEGAYTIAELPGLFGIEMPTPAGAAVRPRGAVARRAARPDEERGTLTAPVVVVGAGVIGLAVALRLAERGERVVIVDAATPGAGTSGTSYAWLNANRKVPRTLPRAEPGRRGGLPASLAGRGGSAVVTADGPHRMGRLGCIEGGPCRDRGRDAGLG